MSFQNCLAISQSLQNPQMFCTLQISLKNVHMKFMELFLVSICSRFDARIEASNDFL